MNRKKIPKAIEAQVLIESKRRCCLCFHFHGDLEMKNGQIAHINKRSSDNSFDNLVFLCFDHHDNYDSTRSQSKGVTALELKHAKDLLRDNLPKNSQADSIKITISVEGDFHKLTPKEREQVLANILTSAKIDTTPKILDIEPGSIKFTIEIGSKDALQLVSSFNDKKLTEKQVIDIKIAEEIKKEDIHFRLDFKDLRNGISKSDALGIVQNYDSKTNLYRFENQDTETIELEIYLKQLSYKHSALLIAKPLGDNELNVVCVLPFSHSDIGYRRGSDPIEVLGELIQKFGLAITFGVQEKLIFKDDLISIPAYVRNDDELLQFIKENISKHTVDDHILVCVSRETKIVSNNAHMTLMFVIQKTKYYESLKKVGVKPKAKGSFGLFVGVKDKEKTYFPS